MNGEGPNFLCIGQQKAATTWLYDQLQFHPEFWMPPVKELHYLTGSFPHRKTLIEIERLEGPSNKLLKWQKRRAEMNLRALEERDIAFFRFVKALEKEPLTLARYVELFRFKGRQLSGDITPTYSAMEERKIAELMAFLPSLKILLLIRDPIERAWSEICKRHRAGEFDASLLSDPEAFAQRVFTPTFTARSFGTRIALRWMMHVPADQLFIGLFDDIAADPAKARASILAFLGASLAPGALEAGFNRKQDYAKLPMPGPIKALLIDRFAEELTASAELFGGAARRWSAQYGLART